MLEDDVVFSRINEEADFSWNKTKEDRVVVVGLKSSKYPSGLGERKEFLSGLIRPLIEEINGEVVFDIYPRPTHLNNDRIPPFVVRFPSVAECVKFKRDAYRLSSNHDALAGAGFYPCVTPATRVRVEVLRAIARKLTKDDQSGYCPLYGSRPLLHIGPKVNGKITPKETLTYITAVQRYRHLINIRDLYFAYQTLGTNFGGCLRQTFIVLNEDDRKASEAARNRDAQTNRGTKRTMQSNSGPKAKK